CVAAALAECGSTTGQLCWSGAEGVQCCYAFDVKALKGLKAATLQREEADRQQEETGQLTGEKDALKQGREKQPAAYRATNHPWLVEVEIQPAAELYQ
ncbi:MULTISPECIES: hypothetical protein, partial [Klebsiella]|uniref:hypothetical protein n=1 Tax=Klebsiella pneumoniae complex TaxID=3390273 RepID=UPI000B9F0340